MKLLCPCSKKAASVLFLSITLLSSTRGDDDRLGLSDLPGVNAALSGVPPGVPSPVRFRDLWEHTSAFQGRPVIVNGRILRTFRQEAVGHFPALAEVWITSAAGDPFCLVLPASASIPAPGKEVRFTGTFLKLIRYAAHDGARLAPLIVGGAGPVEDTIISGEDGKTDNRQETGSDRSAWSLASWALGLSAAALVASLLAWRHWNSPRRPAASRAGLTTTSADPALEFIDGRGDHDV